MTHELMITAMAGGPTAHHIASLVAPPPAARMMTHEPNMAAMAGGPTAYHIASLVAPRRQYG